MPSSSLHRAEPWGNRWFLNGATRIYRVSFLARAAVDSDMAEDLTVLRNSLNGALVHRLAVVVPR